MLKVKKKPLSRIEQLEIWLVDNFNHPDWDKMLTEFNYLTTKERCLTRRRSYSIKNEIVVDWKPEFKRCNC